MSDITVYIVDDSAVVRKYLTEMLERGGITVLGAAADPLLAWPRMEKSWPNVIVLDVEMPHMDGISFLRKIMKERPTPVVMCSALTQAGCTITSQAMEAGAIAVITKPRLGLKQFLEDDANGLVPSVIAAANANIGVLKNRMQPPIAPQTVAAHRQTPAFADTTDRVIAIGLSTGGVQSIETVLQALPRDLPGIVIVQHMPEFFTASFAQRLNSICDIEVLEARNGDRVLAGRALVAPGGKHMRLKRSATHYVVEVVDGPLVNHHRPSVDVLFGTVASCAGCNAIGVIMTGMGDDGARGMREMHDAGAYTAAQDEASCVVFGMPMEAIKLGGVDDVLPLESVADWLKMMATRRPRILSA